jgi:8-oxo-dGTP diphosphatase
LRQDTRFPACSENKSPVMNRCNPTKVTAAIMSSNAKLFIAKRPAGDKRAHKWEFPGGKIRDHETPEDCLTREMKEEFDIDVLVGEFFGSCVYHYPDISIELLAYRTKWVSGALVLKAHDEYRWASLQELETFDFAPADIPLVQMISRGEIGL